MRIAELTPILVSVRFGVLARTVELLSVVERVLLGCLMSLATEAPIHVRTIPPVTTTAATVATVVTTTDSTKLTANARLLTVTLLAESDLPTLRTSVVEDVPLTVSVR